MNVATLKHLRASFLVFDPGLQGLRSAGRGTLTVVLAFIIMSRVAASFHLFPTLPFLAAIVAMVCAIVISDSKLKDQKKTVLLMSVPATLGVVSSIFLGPHPMMKIMVFLMVTFMAVYLRRFGPRFIALGLMSFMTYFCPLFFPMPQEIIPWAIVAVFNSLLLTYILRFWIFPDRPRHLLSLYLESFEFQFQEAFKSMAQFLTSPDKKHQQRYLKIKSSVNELTLIIEQFLNANDTRNLKSDSEILQMSLFEKELILRQIMDEAERLTPEEKAEAAHALLTQTVSPSLAQHPFHGRLLSLINFKTSELKETVLEQEVSVETMKVHGLHLTTRQAIQATVATGLASFLGFSVSHERWYWASLTAFVVFVGASRGETLMRASLRVIGTMSGLVAGFIIAHLLNGYVELEWSVVILCLFVGLFSTRLMYGFWTASAFTLLLPLLFNILGLLTPKLLILRLEETAIGAIVGVVISAIVLPVSTKKIFHTALDNLLRTVYQILRKLPLEMTGSSKRSLVTLLRQMDKDLLSLKIAAAPIVGRYSPLKDSNTSTVLHDASALTHFIRHLSTAKLPSDETLKQEIKMNFDQLLQGSELSASQHHLTTLFERVKQLLKVLTSR